MVVNKITKGNGSRNDQRSNAMNPNNSAYQASLDNRSRQLNPEDEAYEKSRTKEKDEEEEYDD